MYFASFVSDTLCVHKITSRIVFDDYSYGKLGNLFTGFSICLYHITITDIENTETLTSLLRCCRCITILKTFKDSISLFEVFVK